MTEFLCIDRQVMVSEEISKSKFITYAYPLEKESDAQQFLDGLRKQHYSATHICYAYSFMGNARFSDDGEPSGTAGQPILSALKGFDNLLVAVVRYFGGIKLGTGGLARAYRGCAVDALNSADVVVYLSSIDVSLECSYSEYQILSDLIKRWKAQVVSEKFLHNIEVVFSLPLIKSEVAILKLDAMQLSYTKTECIRAYKKERLNEQD